MMNVTKALIIASPFIERILAGTKTWEMRSTATKQRGRVALVRKGSGLIVGTVDLTDSIGPFTTAEMLDSTDRHGIEPARILSGLIDKWKHAWVLSNVITLQRPVSYQHPAGAVIWVSLTDSVRADLARAS
jgi:hypothetical protein